MRLFFLSVALIFMVSCQQFQDIDLFRSGMSDEQLSVKVQQVIKQDPMFTAIDMQIVTMKGQVQLSGYVKTIRQSDLAQELASKVAGVKGVENNLIVRK